MDIVITAFKITGALLLLIGGSFLGGFLIFKASWYLVTFGEFLATNKKLSKYAIIGVFISITTVFVFIVALIAAYLNSIGLLGLKS